MHDSVRDEVYNMYRSAGLVARTEVKDMLPDNGDIPGDIVVEGMPNTGNGLVIDVTVTDSRTITEGDSLVSLQRRASTVGVEAREKEESKRNKKGGVGNERMQDRVRAIGYNFCPIAFEVDGAVGDTWSRNLKQLSEIAHERRGSNRASFRTKWTARLGICLAKEGAKYAVRHANRLVSRHKGSNAAFEDRDVDPVFEPGVRDVIVMGDPGWDSKYI